MSYGFCLCKVLFQKAPKLVNMFTSRPFVDYKWETQAVIQRCTLETDLG